MYKVKNKFSNVGMRTFLLINVCVKLVLVNEKIIYFIY